MVVFWIYSSFFGFCLFFPLSSPAIASPVRSKCLTLLKVEIKEMCQKSWFTIRLVYFWYPFFAQTSTGSHCLPWLCDRDLTVILTTSYHNSSWGRTLLRSARWAGGPSLSKEKNPEHRWLGQDNRSSISEPKTWLFW